uniref:Uncharacterized protein n=1 Tax=Candidatus Kentrum sp. LPFa TaxID=2126335 RepID=A0A450W4N0_9GAMM|nr:MAG: hypothetical protein BECKLPF1236A_GA0070988_1006212 [Candidatus Kentron sp. LPFa]VFK27887.1 MAG: hypothetical protein BECKLPF1236C_GA0070990_1005414 [Candidatus Kentron sp. LPFa]
MMFSVDCDVLRLQTLEVGVDLFFFAARQDPFLNDNGRFSPVRKLTTVRNIPGRPKPYRQEIPDIAENMLALRAKAETG